MVIFSSLVLKFGGVTANQLRYFGRRDSRYIFSVVNSPSFWSLSKTIASAPTPGLFLAFFNACLGVVFLKFWVCYVDPKRILLSGSWDDLFHKDLVSFYVNKLNKCI